MGKFCNKRIFSLIITFIFVAFFLIVETKTGDWHWYILHSNNIPNDHPLIYILMTGFNSVIRNAEITVYITEIFCSCLLVLSVYLVSFKFSKSHYISLYFAFASFIAPYVNSGTPLKSTLGLALFFVFFYVLIHKSKCKVIGLGIIYLLILFTHVVASFLVLGLITFYLFRGFKINRKYFTESNFSCRMLCLCLVYLMFWIVSQFDFIFNSNSKIFILAQFTMGDLVNSVVVINSSRIILYEIVWIVSFIVAVYKRKIDYVDLFLFFVCGFLLVYSTSYNPDVFGRFMGIIPFFSVLQISRIVSRLNIKLVGK